MSEAASRLPASRPVFWRQRGWPLVAACLLAVAAGVGIAEWLGWPFLAAPLARYASEKLDRRIGFADPARILSGAKVSPADAAPDAFPDFQVRFLGGIRLRVKHLTVAAPAWSQEARMLLAEQVQLDLRYTDLWRSYQSPQTEPLRIARLQAAHLDGTFERLQDGRASWQFGPAADLTSAAARRPAPVFGQLQIGSGAVSYRDVPLASNLHIQMSLLGGDQPTAAAATAASSAAAQAAEPAIQNRAVLQLKATGQYRNLPLQLALRSTGALPWLNNESEALPVDMSMHAVVGRAKFFFSGSALDILHLRGLAGEFSLTGPSLAAAGEPLGVSLPNTAAFRTAGYIAKDAGIWRVLVKDAAVGASKLTAAMTFDPTGAVPLLSGRLGGSRLLLVDLGPAVGVKPAGEAIKNVATFTASTAGRKVLPDQPFDFNTLRAMDANVLIDIQELDLNTRVLEPLRPVHAHLLLKGGVLLVQDLRASAAQGQLSGQLRLDGRAERALWNADLRWDGVRLERWLKLARSNGAPPYVSGRLTGRAVLQGQGRSTAEILATLTGRTRTELLDGSISHLVVELAGLDIAESLGFFIAGDKALPVTCGVVDLTVDRGLLTPRMMVIDTTDSALWMTGSLSLATESMDLQAVVVPKDFSPLTLRAPLRVRGNFAKPEVSIELQTLGLKLAGTVLLALVNPLAALLPLIDMGDPAEAQRGAAGCQQLAQRVAAKRQAAAVQQGKDPEKNKP